MIGFAAHVRAAASAVTTSDATVVAETSVAVIAGASAGANANEGAVYAK